MLGLAGWFGVVLSAFFVGSLIVGGLLVAAVRLCPAPPGFEGLGGDPDFDEWLSERPY